MIVWGIQPGPSRFTRNPELDYSIAGIMIVATLLALGLSLLRMRSVAKLLDLPRHFLWTIILIFCMVGTYAVNNSIFDVGVMLLFGLDRKSTRLNSSHVKISYAVFCLKKKNRESHSD